MTRDQNIQNFSPVIAERLREARKRAGISQKSLGILAGIDEFSASARMNQYERGKHIPDFALVEKFAKILHMPTEFFYARDDMTAEMLLLFAQLPMGSKAELIAELKMRCEES